MCKLPDAHGIVHIVTLKVEAYIPVSEMHVPGAAGIEKISG